MGNDRVNNLTIRNATVQDVAETVRIHTAAFPGFFLSSLGAGFLQCMYQAYTYYAQASLLVAIDPDGKQIGFAAFSNNVSGVYKYMLKTNFLKLTFHVLIAAMRRPRLFAGVIRRAMGVGVDSGEDDTVELTSIGVSPAYQGEGAGRSLLDAVKGNIDFRRFSFLSLTTDAKDNEQVNAFYLKNGFQLHRTFATREGRVMHEYRYHPKETAGTEQDVETYH